MNIAKQKKTEFQLAIPYVFFKKGQSFPREGPPVAKRILKGERVKTLCSLICLLLQITEGYSLKRNEKYMPLNTSHTFYESLYINCKPKRVKDACTKFTIRGVTNNIKSRSHKENTGRILSISCNFLIIKEMSVVTKELSLYT